MTAPAARGITTQTGEPALSTIQTILFESPLYLMPLLLVGEFVLLRRWATRQTPNARRAVVGGLVVAALLLLMQHLVVTEREKLIGLCNELAAAAVKGDVDGIGGHISDRFAAEGLDRDGFLDYVRRGLTAVEVRSARLSGFEISIEDGRLAKVLFNASARVYGAAEGLGGSRPSRWELHFEKTGDCWRVVFLTPRRLPFFPFDSLRELLHGVGG